MLKTILAAALMVSSIVSAASMAQAQTAGGGDTSTLSPSLAQVRLVDTQGQALAGQTINIQIEPTSIVSYGPRSWPVIGTATVGADGVPRLTSLSLASTPLAGFVSNDWVTVQLDAVAGAQDMPLDTFSVYLGTDANTRAEAIGAIGAFPAAPVSTSTARVLRRESQAPLTSTDAGTSCTNYWSVVGNGDYYTVIGELHTRYWATDSQFRYGSQADSNIGVGVSSDGGSTWSVSGSVHISNSNSQTATIDQYSQNWGHQLQVLVHYQELRQYFSCWGWSQNYQVQATIWDGGGFLVGQDKSSYDGLYSQPGSVAMFPNQSYSRTSGSAVTFSGGVTAFGAGLTTQSGYSSYVTLYWRSRSDSGGYGCLYGSHGDYPSTAGIIYAGPYGSLGC